MNISNRPTPSRCDTRGMDLITQVAVEFHQNAQQSEEMARKTRRAAQMDRIVLMTRTATKLREMADNTFFAGIYQGALGLANAACSMGASMKEFQADYLKTGAESMKEQGRQLSQHTDQLPAQIAHGSLGKIITTHPEERAAGWAETANATAKQARQIDWAKSSLNEMGQVANAISRCDPFSIQQQYQAVEKQELEIEAEKASNKSQEQHDKENESRRLQNSVSSLLDKLNEARHAATMASIRL